MAYQLLLIANGSANPRDLGVRLDRTPKIGDQIRVSVDDELKDVIVTNVDWQTPLHRAHGAVVDVVTVREIQHR